jgi:ferritin-like metal-binding protein YciE
MKEPGGSTLLEDSWRKEMGLNTLEDVLLHGMKDLLSAEKQFRQALPKLAKAAEDKELASAFLEHRDETVEQISRLERCFKILDRSPRAEKCKAAEGLVEEGAGVIEEDGEGVPKDVTLSSAGRKTEHYEIASYEDVLSCARTLGQTEIAELLEATLKEEEAAAQKLKTIGERLASSNGFAVS